MFVSVWKLCPDMLLDCFRICFTHFTPTFLPVRFGKIYFWHVVFVYFEDCGFKLIALGTALVMFYISTSSVLSSCFCVLTFLNSLCFP